MELKVIAVTSIKSKKPWRGFTWLGKKKKELFVIDRDRFGQVDLASGKVRKKVPKVSSYFKTAVTITASNNGSWLASLLDDGNLVLWDKDANELRHVAGMPAFALKKSELSYYHLPRLHVSNDGFNVILVYGYNKVYLWKAESRADNGQGRWLFLSEPSEIILPSPECKEADMSFTFFFNDPVFGQATIGSFIFNIKQHLVISNFNFRLSVKPSKIENCDWTTMKIHHRQIHPSFTAIRHRYAYVSSYSHSGHLLAIAANQSNPFATAVLFVNAISEAVIVTSMKGCGATVSKVFHDRNYWIASLAWTSDDLHVVTMTGQGTVCLLTRLGQLLTISTQGLSLNKMPNLFLNFHPLITVRGNNARKDDDDSLLESECSVANRMKQRFSIQTHPSEPVFICSDGYMSTTLQLPQEWSERTQCLKSILHSAYTNLIAAETHFSSNNAIHFIPRTLKSDGVNSSPKFPNLNLFTSLDGTLCGESSPESTIGRICDITGGQSSGKIEFSGLNSNELSDQNVSKSNVDHCCEGFFCAWGILVSSHHSWIKDFTYMTDLLFKAIKRFCFIILHTDSGSSSLHWTKDTTPAKSPRLEIVTKLLKRLVSMLKFDKFYRNLMYKTVAFIHLVLRNIFKRSFLQQELASIELLTKTMNFINEIESSLNGSYQLQSNLYKPELIRLSSNDIRINLMESWRLLYQKSVHYNQHLLKHTSDSPLIGDAQQLICRIQAIMISRGAKISEFSVGKFHGFDDSTTSFLHGDIDKAINVWFTDVEQKVSRMFQENENAVNLTGTLHSLLFCLLLRGQLGRILELMDGIICQESPNDNTMTSPGFDFASSLQCFNGLRFQSVRSALQSFARFFAMYFSNQKLFVFPPHNVKELPPLTKFPAMTENLRKLWIRREDISQAINSEKLEEIITPDSVVELLMLTGLHDEATWFSYMLGDWRATLLFSIACEHQQFSLPTHLQSSFILKSRIMRIFGVDLGQESAKEISKDVTQYKPDLDASALVDLLLASLFLNNDLVPEIGEALMLRLNDTIKSLTLVVDDSIYLPAPPLYYSQIQFDGSPSGSFSEARTRENISAITYKLLSLLRISVFAVSSSVWYVKQLQALWKSFVVSSTEEEPTLNDILTSLEGCRYSGPSCCAVEDHIDDPSIRRMLHLFRSLCFTHWMLHTRDMLCLSIRKMLKELKKNVENSTASIKSYQSILYWSYQLFFCSKDLGWVNELLHIVLSVTADMSPSTELFQILSFCFANGELSTDIEDRLNEIFSNWENAYTASEIFPSSTSFRDVYESVCRESREQLIWREEFFGRKKNSVIFRCLTGNELTVGNRDAEFENKFYEFLSFFIELCVTNEHDNTSGEFAMTNPLPLIPTFADVHVDNHLLVETGNASVSHSQQRGSLIQLSSSSTNLFRSKSQSHIVNRSPEKIRENASQSNDALSGPDKQVTFKKEAVDGPKRWISSFEFPSSSAQNLDTLNESTSLPALNIPDSFSSILKSGSFLRLKDNYAGSFPTVKTDVLVNKLGQDYEKMARLLAWVHRWNSDTHGKACQSPTKKFKPRFRISVSVPKILTAVWLLKNNFEITSCLQVDDEPLLSRVSEAVENDIGGDRDITLPSSISNVPIQRSSSVETLQELPNESNESASTLSGISRENLGYDRIATDSVISAASSIDNTSTDGQNCHSYKDDEAVPTDPKTLESLQPSKTEDQIVSNPDNSEIQTRNDSISRVEFQEFIKKQQENFNFLISSLGIPKAGQSKDFNGHDIDIAKTNQSEPSGMVQPILKSKNEICGKTKPSKSVRIDTKRKLRPFEQLRLLSEEDENDVSHISHSSTEGLIIRQSAEKEDSPQSQTDPADANEILARMTSDSSNRSNLRNEESSDSQDTLNSLISPDVFEQVNQTKSSNRMGLIRIPLLQLKSSSLSNNLEHTSVFQDNRRMHQTIDRYDFSKIMKVVEENHNRTIGASVQTFRPLTLLSIPPESKPVQKKPIQNASSKMPSLINPDVIIAHEQKILLENSKSFGRQDNLENVGFQLMNFNKMEPWQPKDGRDKLARQQRRRSPLKKSQSAVQEVTGHLNSACQTDEFKDLPLSSTVIHAQTQTSIIEDVIDLSAASPKSEAGDVNTENEILTDAPIDCIEMPEEGHKSEDADSVSAHSYENLMSKEPGRSYDVKDAVVQVNIFDSFDDHNKDGPDEAQPNDSISTKSVTNQAIQTDNLMSSNHDELTHHILSSRNIESSHSPTEVDEMCDQDLTSMSRRLRVLENFSNNLQTGFTSTKMLLRTIETLGSDDLLNYATKDEEKKQNNESTIGTLDSIEEIDDVSSETNLDNEEQLHVSGLSGLSDIFEELMVDPKIAREVGLAKSSYQSKDEISNLSKEFNLPDTKKEILSRTQNLGQVHSIVRNQQNRLQKRRNQHQQDFELRKASAMKMMDELVKDVKHQPRKSFDKRDALKPQAKLSNSVNHSRIKSKGYKSKKMSLGSKRPFAVEKPKQSVKFLENPELLSTYIIHHKKLPESQNKNTNRPPWK